MDPNYKPPSSPNVAMLPPRKPSPRFSMDFNVSTTPGHSPRKSQKYQNIKISSKKLIKTDYFSKEVLYIA